MMNMHEWAFSEITIYKHIIIFPPDDYMLYCETASGSIVSRPISAAVDFAQLKPRWFDLRNNEIWCFASRRANMLTSLTVMDCYKCVRVCLSWLAWRFVRTYSISMCISWKHSMSGSVYFVACVLLVLYDLELSGFARFPSTLIFKLFFNSMLPQEVQWWS